MAIKNLKRIPYYISVALLTGGASLTIGLLVSAECFLSGQYGL